MAEILTVENVANGAALFVFSLLALFGVRRPRNQQARDMNSSFEVAGALIDSSQAKNLVMAMTALTAAYEKNTTATEHSTEALERIGRKVEDLQGDVRAATTELVRSQR